MCAAYWLDRALAEAEHLLLKRFHTGDVNKPGYAVVSNPHHWTPSGVVHERIERLLLHSYGDRTAAAVLDILNKQRQLREMHQKGTQRLGRCLSCHGWVLHVTEWPCLP